MTVAAKLKKFLDTHLPIDAASSRAVQRAAALWLGHDAGKIEPDALRALCTELGLFDYEGREGDNNFGANFTQNMKKDVSYFVGDHHTGWKLTPDGKAEAKSIFEEGNPPTRRRVGDGPRKSRATKPKKVKAAKAPKAAAKPKKAAEPKVKAPAKPKPKAKPKKAEAIAPAPASSETDRKAAAKRRALAKKRDLSGGEAPAEAPAPAEAAAAPTVS
jgi:hypothetical protein